MSFLHNHFALLLLAGFLTSGLVLGVNAQGQRWPEAAEKFRMQHFTAADGLPSNEVYAIAEDSLGFLWFGTSHGLVRYDGYTFKKHFLSRPGDSTSIGGSHIQALHVDATGHLWAGGGYQDPAGFSRYVPATERFRRYLHDPKDLNSLLGDEVQSIVTSPDDPGTLWIGTSRYSARQGAGLSRLDVATGTFARFTTEDIRSSNGVWSMLMDREGTLWLGTTGGVLHHFDPATNTFDAFLLHLDHRLMSIHVDRAGVLWVGTEGSGLSRFDQETERFTSFLPQPGMTVVNSILEDRAGTLWVGTPAGLFTFDRETERFTRIRDQPPDLNIWSLHEDRFGVLWAGSYGNGLMKVDRRINPFTIYQHDPGDANSLATNLVNAIYEDSRGRLWIGTGGWLNRVDRTTGTVTRYLQEAKTIYEDGAGTLWIGSHGGLTRMDQETGRFTRLVHDPDVPSSISSGFITHILEDHAGNLWITLWGGGIDRMDRETGTFTHYTPASHGLGDNRVLRLYEATSEPGILWAGTDGGLSRFDTQAKTFTNYHAEPLGRSMMMHEDRQGQFWVATARNGLHLFDRETGILEQSFTTEDGLPHNVVRSVYEDDQGFLWLSTDNGLSKFDPEARTFRNYYERDGLPGNAFREHADHQSASGELFFGGPDGAVSFFPEGLVENPVPPGVVLTGLRIAEDPVEIGVGGPLEASMTMTKAITLSHSQNYLTFEYVGLQFIDSSQNQYRYMMEGYDADWVDAGSQQSARYTNLDPDHYVFRVTARKGDGPWNEAGASVQITILSPWWRTTWAYLIYGLLFLAGVVAVNRVQRRRLIRKEREQAMRRELQQTRQIEAMNVQLRQHEQQLEDQNRNLLELDQLKSRFFANISHEFRTPLTLLLGPLQDALDGVYGPVSQRLRHQHALMQGNARRLLRLINQLLDLSRLEAGNLTLCARRADLVPLVKAATEAFASMAQRKDITLQVDVPQHEIPLYLEADKLETVLYNLLSNAFKFTPKHGKIRVSVEDGAGEAGGYVEIVVRDTGRGIPAEELPYIFDRFHQVDASSTREHEGTGIGLALTKELLALHGGTIRVESQEGFGATFFVRLPKGRAHLGDEDIVEAEIGDEAPEATGAEAPLEAVDDVLASDERLHTGDGQAGLAEEAPVILIVEDNADMRAYLKGHLASDYHIVEAVDGVEGLEQARAREPALVLSDVMMPRMDGYDLCRAVKADEKLSHIPVVLLTAKADAESKIEGLETGADDYLAKPFDREELLARVENLIEIRRRLRARFSDKVRLGPHEIAVSSAEAAFVERVRAAVEADLSNSGLTMEELAASVGVSLRQLHRRLKATVGLTPAGYVRMMRLARAAQLLKQEAGTVSEVAYAVGFNDADYFSRLFKQTHGVSPSQYRTALTS